MKKSIVEQFENGQIVIVLIELIGFCIGKIIIRDGDILGINDPIRILPAEGGKKYVYVRMLGDPPAFYWEKSVPGISVVLDKDIITDYRGAISTLVMPNTMAMHQGGKKP
jgi:hypothetical protein